MCGSSNSAAAALPADVARSLAAALQQSALAFCAACYALHGAGAGPTLRAEARALAAGVVAPCVALLDAAGTGAGGDVKRAVGRVWAGCDAAAKAPADNRAALFRGLAGVMAVLKDTLREMGELRAEAGNGGDDGSDDGDGDDDDDSSNSSGGGGDDGGEAGGSGAAGAAAAGGGGGDDAPADLDLDCGRLSAREEALLAAGVELMEAAAAVVRALGRALLAGPPLRAAAGGGDDGGDVGCGALDGWESELYHARALRRCVEDLGAALFPPADAAEAAGAAEAAATTCELMLDECPALDAAGSELDGLAARVRAASDAVAKAAAAVGAEAADAAVVANGDGGEGSKDS